MSKALSGVRFPVVSSLPTASTHTGEIFEMAGQLYKSTGVRWGLLRTNQLSGIRKVDIAYSSTLYKSLAPGTTDLGGPAAGKRWRLSWAFATYISGGTGSIKLCTKRSGTYYTWTSSAINSSIGSTIAMGVNVPIIENGDQFALITATTTMNIFISIEEFSTDSPLKSLILLSLASGNNTLYTCPSGYTARLLCPSSFGLGIGATAGLNPLIYRNDSGASRDVYYNFVASGGSPGAPGVSSNACVHVATTVTNDSTGVYYVPNYLDAGDFINFNTNAATATQSLFTHVLETPIYT